MYKEIVCLKMSFPGDTSSINILSLNRVITTLQDPEAFGWVYAKTSVNLFQSFWARFGWNQIRLASLWYWFLLLLSGISLIGALLQLPGLIAYKPYPWRIVIVWLSISAFLVWLQAIFRPGFPVNGQPLFLPSARYAYPAVIPTVIPISAGFISIMNKFLNQKMSILLLILSFVGVDIVSIISIFQYYNR